MFGQNEIVGKKFFKDVTDKMYVTSIFLTLQGEGPLMGQPAVFVRFAKCNLNCHFCDTFFDTGDWLTIKQINTRITKTINQYFKDKGLPTPDWAKDRRMALICTGGEPFLQPLLGRFLETTGKTFKTTQIESNGTLISDIPDSTILVVSPKCNEKTQKYMNLTPKVLNRVNALKFVVSADPNSPYNTIPQWAHDWHKHWDDIDDSVAYSENNPVYISPMNIYNKITENQKIARAFGKDIKLEERSKVDEVVSFWEKDLLNMEENQKNHEYAAKYVMECGFTLNLQMHLYCSLA